MLKDFVIATSAKYIQSDHKMGGRESGSSGEVSVPMITQRKTGAGRVREINSVGLEKSGNSFAKKKTRG